MELKNLAIGTLLFALIVGGLVGFVSHFQESYTTTDMDSNYKNTLDVYSEVNTQANELDDKSQDEGGEEDTGSWSWNPMDWQIFKAFNVIKWLRNLISVPKAVLSDLPGLFGFDSLTFYANALITLFVIAVAFAILVAFTKSGKL